MVAMLRVLGVSRGFVLPGTADATCSLKYNKSAFGSVGAAGTRSSFVLAGFASTLGNF